MSWADLLSFYKYCSLQIKEETFASPKEKKSASQRLIASLFYSFDPPVKAPQRHFSPMIILLLKTPSISHGCLQPKCPGFSGNLCIQSEFLKEYFFQIPDT